MRSVSHLCPTSLLCLVAVLLPVGVRAQDPASVTIKATVIDAVTGAPIQGVLGSLADLGLELVTDSTGAIILTNIALGTHQLSLRHEDYRPESGRLTVDKAGEIVLRLNPLEGPGASEMSRVQGQIRDVDGGRPLEGALVRFPQLRLADEADSNGKFRFENVPPGGHMLTVEILGYAAREEAVEVEARKIVDLALTLSVDPIELDPIEVSVEGRSLDLELSGFYQRREETSGYFISREMIEERAPIYTTDLFRGLAGIKIVDSGWVGSQHAVLLTGSREISFSSEKKPCYPAVWMDGQMVHQGSQDYPAYLDNLIGAEQLAGIEIYNSPASMPVQYNFNGGCGVIVLWTRYGGGSPEPSRDDASGSGKI